VRAGPETIAKIPTPPPASIIRGFGSLGFPSLGRLMLYVSMKIAEYKTVTGSDWVSLDNTVTQLLAQGYQLYGNPYCGWGAGKGFGDKFTVAQAMVKGGLHDPAPLVESVATTLIAP
jgi:hypothetical protein